jgi:hypothetical protein
MIPSSSSHERTIIERRDQLQLEWRGLGEWSRVDLLMELCLLTEARCSFEAASLLRVASFSSRGFGTSLRSVLDSARERRSHSGAATVLPSSTSIPRFRGSSSGGSNGIMWPYIPPAPCTHPAAAASRVLWWREHSAVKTHLRRIDRPAPPWPHVDTVRSEQAGATARAWHITYAYAHGCA